MGNKSHKNMGPEPLRGKQASSRLTEKYLERLRRDRMEHLRRKVDTSEVAIEVNNVRGA